MVMKFKCVIGSVVRTRRHAMVAWLNENVGERFVTWDIKESRRMLFAYRFYFKNDRDLTLFLLRWS